MRLTLCTPGTRFAARAASIAVLPPPITATYSPSSPHSPFLYLSRKSKTSVVSPSLSANFPCFQAPLAIITYLKPASFSSATLRHGAFATNSAP